jgi:cytochrome c oxidase subunit III
MTAGTPVDLSRLPTTTVGHRSMMWWGTVGFVIIEGSTLVIMAFSYIYLGRNFDSWPPANIPPPTVVPFAIQAAVMLLSLVPMVMVDRAVRRLDLRTVRYGMVVSTVLAVVMCVIRVFEFRALHVRWDSAAYGSVAWGVLVAHATLLLLETAESAVFTAVLFKPDLEERDISAASDNAIYWYFLTLSWLPLGGLVFLSPSLR